jgi:CheY-like chemotaxis protein
MSRGSPPWASGRLRGLLPEARRSNVDASMGASAVVAGAAGGEEGYASETLPDLIIGDLSLPVMDG